MYETCQAKQNEVKALFSASPSETEKYEKIIALGRSLPKMDPQYKVPANIVKGCQSTVYLHAAMREGKVFYEIESDALISSGLAAILLLVYNGETPETILKCPPAYLEELGISASLTPNRANGLYSIHLRMKQEALQLLLKSAK